MKKVLMFFKRIAAERLFERFVDSCALYEDDTQWLIDNRRKVVDKFIEDPHIKKLVEAFLNIEEKIYEDNDMQLGMRQVLSGLLMID